MVETTNIKHNFKQFHVNEVANPRDTAHPHIELLPPIKNNFRVHPKRTNQQENSCFLKFYSENIFFGDKNNVQKPAMYRE